MTKLRNERHELPIDESVKVVVSARGPYLLYGKAPIAQQFIMPDQMGESWFYQQGREYTSNEKDDESSDTPVALCRCGASRDKPFCDGAHLHAEWDGSLTAPMDRLLDGARYFEGEELLLSDNERYCCYARFCHPGGGAWQLTEASSDPEARDLAIREASMCPSARLMAWGRGADTPYEFDFERSVGLLEDPAIECSGGIWLRGGIPVEREDGERYEVRNRVVLCRCGKSHNKPYCDGAHAAQMWNDGIQQEMPQGERLPDEELEIV